MPPLTPQEVQALFTRSDGSYLFARWARPIVPVVFGVDDASLPVIRAAFEAVVAPAGHEMAEVDPELGANLMVFFVRDWAELPEAPNLDRLVPELRALCDRLVAAEANQYRIFRFEADGAIKAAFVFLRMDAHLSAVAADTLALAQAVQTVLLWSDRAFTDTPPLRRVGGEVMLRSEIAAVIRAGYDPVLPAMARDASHALRLAARIGRLG
jgi:hypothetical protein